MKSARVPLLCLAFVLVLSGGCAQRRPAAANAQLQTTPSSVKGGHAAIRFADFSYRFTPTYHSRIYDKYAYKITLTNPNPYPIRAIVWIQFLDKDGFEVGKDSGWFSMPPDTTQVVSAEAMVQSPGASEFTHVNVTVDALQ